MRVRDGQPGPGVARAVRHGGGRAAPWLAALVLLLAAAGAAADDSGLGRLFEGVAQGTGQAVGKVLGQAPPAGDQAPPPPAADQQRRAATPSVAAAEQGETLPPPRVEGTVPLSGWDAQGDVDVEREPNGNVSMVVRNASLSRVLSLLAQTYDLNVVAANDIDAIISITLHDVPLEQALSAILSVANYTWVERQGIILVTSLSDAATLSADVQGRRVQVFHLDFSSASAIAEAVTGLLSPVGKIAVTSSDSADNRRTREMIVVEDMPAALERIANYIHQVDTAPRQVLIEVHILQVDLEDETSNGVDFDALFRIAGAPVNIISAPNLAAAFNSLAEAAAGGSDAALEAPSFLATVDGHDLQAVVELLEQTRDAKSLGSPKLLVLNNQEANIHVGRNIGYQTTITTELQSTGQPQFLEVGVELRITPRITRDGRVLLHVEPKVSDGDINPDTDAPDEDTTELSTDVMLCDGEGMIIGGLIREDDTTVQTKLPYLGDVWGVGALFRKTTVTKERREVIFAITPRIQPYDREWHDYEQGELVRAETPLFDGPLCRTDRPWEPTLPDGIRVARPLCPPADRPPEMAPPRDCVSPTPPYIVPRKPFAKQSFPESFPEGDWCDEDSEPAPAMPPSWQPGAAVFEGQSPAEPRPGTWSGSAVISDQ